MIWAIQNSTRTEAYPNQRAQCPSCQGEVLSKCGEIVTWHWAHLANDCDSWHEPETQWHLDWKRRFPSEWQEVVVGDHRADIKTPRVVIEFQASPISPEDIKAREAHYGPMVWVLKGSDFINNLNLRDRGSYHSFRWKHPRKSWWSSRRPIFIDLDGLGLFELRKLYPNTPCGGWGRFIGREAFLDCFGAKTGNFSREG